MQGDAGERGVTSTAQLMGLNLKENLYFITDRWEECVTHLACFLALLSGARGLHEPLL